MNTVYHRFDTRDSDPLDLQFMSIVSQAMISFKEVDHAACLRYLADRSEKENAK